MDLLFGPFTVTFLIGIITFLLLTWHSLMKQSYWKNLGIPYVKPVPFIGSVLHNIINYLHDVELERYRTLGPIYGHYEGNRPVLSVGDPKLLRDILVKDFHVFPNRRDFKSGDAIFDNVMSAVDGEDWKRIRSIVSPTFSTGKLKRMLSILKDCARTLVQNFKMASQRGEYIDAKKYYGALAMDVIASSAFSTKIDSHNDPENKFVQMAKEAFSFNWRFVFLILCPGLVKLFKMRVFKPVPAYFFTDLTKQIITERKRTGQKRNDFLQLLIDTAEEVSSKEEKREYIEKENDLISNYTQEDMNQKLFKNITTKSLSEAEVVAQCVVFFLAGYETTGSALTCASYLLAVNEDVQEKARQEITECLKETNGELTYEALQSMKYLDNVISETLRMYPPGVRSERKTEADYKLGDTGIVVPKGMIITIPIFALHRDPKHFPNPENFDPNRFSPEERAKIDMYTYQPFGAGPRNCVAMRFALMEIKMCLVHVIACFNIKTCPKTPIPLKLATSSVGALQLKDCILEMEPRDNCVLVK